jgi:hypothetical protein
MHMHGRHIYIYIHKHGHPLNQTYLCLFLPPLLKWMTIDKCVGPRGAGPLDIAVQRDDVVKHKSVYWRVVAGFSKYYNRWALVGEPVPLKETHKVMLQDLLIDKALKPYVRVDYGRMPWATTAPANECEEGGYKLLAETGAEQQAKKMKKTVDMWA